MSSDRGSRMSIVDSDADCASIDSHNDDLDGIRIHYVESPSGNKAPISSIRHVPGRRGHSNPAFVADEEEERRSSSSAADEGIDSESTLVKTPIPEDVTPIPTTDEDEPPTQIVNDEEFIGKKFIDNDEVEHLPNCEDCYKGSSQIIKTIFSILLSLIMLGCLVVSKGSLLFIASQMHPEVTFTANTSNITGTEQCSLEAQCIYSPSNDEDQDTCQETDTVRWLWAMFICQCAPYFFQFLRCAWKMCFKNKNAPTAKTLGIVVVLESLHSAGVFMLLYIILPVVDAFRGLLLFTAVAIVPAFLQIFHAPSNKKTYETVLDVVAFVAQFSALFVWPVSYAISGMFTGKDPCESTFNNTGISTYFGNTIDGPVPEYDVSIYLIPLALILCSISWWENFVDLHTRFSKWNRPLLHFRIAVMGAKTKIYALISIYKIIITFGMLVMYFGVSGMFDGGVLILFKSQSFYGNRCQEDAQNKGEFLTDWLSVSAIQVCVGVIAFYSADLAIKGHMQISSFTLPLVATTPVVFSMLWWACESCHKAWDLPIGGDYFWNCFQGYSDLGENFAELITYIGILWWVSQLWATRYLWFPKVERLAKTDKIFTMPLYCGALLEQSLMFIRRRNDEEDRMISKKYRNRHVEVDDAGVPIPTEKPLLDGYNPLFMKEEDTVTPFVIMCATMWHENEREMVQILHSIIRTDADASARKRAKEINPDFNDPDYYEFELNIFFDDAFQYHTQEDKTYTINNFVLQFMDCLSQAAKKFFDGRDFAVKPPDKYVTPYGGRLVFTLPFGNKVVVHLKDKQKIRNRKRWSQVMYLHYLLGQGIVAQPFDDQFQQLVAENSYILALDGDVDFKPEALILLLDLMKRNKKVAAACGRIHPIGAGPMVWYQKFEYSLSHWLQKSTEHMLGCVLCSPGCFSLFRCSALMDENVVQRYSIMPTRPRDHVQYDQGEDRWLCTLLLQAGHRVEYSAASDAYTYAPEEFKEFYNQRRRWITSTFANIMDLLESGRHTAKKNENISMLYIVYQAVLFGSSILGPATIFLLVTGAVDAVFQTGLGIAILCGLIPLGIFMVVCYKCSNNTQVNTAAVLSAFAAVLQTFVLIGVIRQMVDDGICSPQSFFFLFVCSVFVCAAILHPQEGSNLFYIPIYFLLVPCMYLILMIFSLCNVNSVSWGTREVKQAPTAAQLEEQKKKEAEAASKKVKDPTGLMKYIGMEAGEGESGYSVACGSCCKFMCCLGGKNPQEEMHEVQNQLTTIQMQIHDLKMQESADLDLADDPMNPLHSRMQPILKQYKHIKGDAKDDAGKEEEREEKTDRAEEKKKEAHIYDNVDDPRNLSWINDDRLGHGEYKTLGPIEQKFWEDLIRLYLYPLDADKKKQQETAEELADLRDKVVFGFFLIDILLIVTILAMSLTIEQVPEMAISWNCTVNGETYESQMDPIGFLFIFVFGFIMVIQLCGMFLHRVFTFLQIVSVTIVCGGKTMEDRDMKPEEFVEFIKDLQMPDRVDPDSPNSQDDTGHSTDTSTTRNSLVLPEHGDNAPKPKRAKTVVQKIKTKHKALDSDTIGKSFATKILAVQKEMEEEDEAADTLEDITLNNTRHNARSTRYNKFKKTMRATTRNRNLTEMKDQYHITEDDIEESRTKVRGMLPREFRATHRRTAKERMRRQSMLRDRAYTNQSQASNASHNDTVTRRRRQDGSVQRLDSTLEESTDYGNTMYRLSTIPTRPDGVPAADYNTNNSAIPRGKARPRLKANTHQDSLELDDQGLDMFNMNGLPSPPVDYENERL